MAEQQVTTALSQMSVTNPKPGLKNFPLPRELRDKIYGYLLDSKYTRVKRTLNSDSNTAEPAHDGVVAYKFHTNILAVNRAIHSEAEELLYKRNIFIVVSHRWSDLNQPMGGLAWIPMVSKKHVAGMKKHSARIHSSPDSRALATAARLTGTKAPLKAYILLADDIENFCVAMGFLLGSSHGPILKIKKATLSGTKSSMSLEDMDSKPASFKCELRDTKYRSIDCSTQHKLLAPLASIIRPSQRVTFTGSICDAKEIAQLELVMGPTTMCVNAYWVAFADSLVKAKHIADAALEYDRLDFVLHLYVPIQCYLPVVLATTDLTSFLLQSEPRMLAMMHTICFEAMLSVDCIKLKTNGALQSEKMFFDILGTIGSASRHSGECWKMPAHIDAYLHSFSMYCVLYKFQVDDPSGCTKTVRETAAKLAARNCGPHQAYDLEVLKRYHDQEAILTREILPLDQCSVSQLPFRGITSGENHDETTRARSNGWQDVGYIRSLKDADKQYINKVQNEHGLGITDFDLI